LYSEFVPPPQSDVGPRKPHLISFNDDLTRRLNHLKTLNGLDALKAELDMVGQAHLAQSLARCRTPVDAKVSAERAARFHKLLSHCAHQAHLSSAGRCGSAVLMSF